MPSRAGPVLGLLLAVPAAAQEPPPTAARGPLAEIVVTPPPTEAERRKELREFSREVIRPPRMRQPIAKFAFPVCVTVFGLAPEDTEVIAERIRANAEALGVGADRSPTCLPTVRVAFMAPAAGPPERWLSTASPQLAHLATYQRERVLAEAGPVRAWNKVVVRNFEGGPMAHADPGAVMYGGRPVLLLIEPFSSTDPIVTTEITGAAVLIAREAAEGFTLGQLADYATIRALLGTGSVEAGAPVRTILTLFDDAAPPAGLTDYDKALVRELYDASRNVGPRRVYHDIARAVVAAERSGERGH